MVDAGVFRCEWCLHSWVVSVTAEPAWNVLIFFPWILVGVAFAAPDHPSGLVWLMD